MSYEHLRGKYSGTQKVTNFEPIFGKCNCGNSIWIIGSAISGKGCFTCTTGESDFSDDYEI